MYLVPKNGNNTHQDEFRRVEKAIRKMGKDLTTATAASEAVRPAKRGKCEGFSTKSLTATEAVALAFPVIDVRSILDSDPRVRQLPGQSSATATNSSSTPSPFNLPYDECVSVSALARVYSVSIQGVASGLYIIADAISPAVQREWAKLALERYSRANHTNLTNLARLAKLDKDKERAVKKGNGEGEEEGEARGEGKSEAEIVRGAQEGGTKIEFEFENEVEEKEEREDVWMSALRDGNNFTSSGFHRLRWSCLGYHYDWTERKYEEDLLSPFPSELSDLCKNMAAHVGQHIIPEAAIVNFYPQGSYMSGHVDDAELTMDEPIVSVSLGRSAIFLLGGRTKEVTPVPILVHSGDVVIMSGESRFSYHGVPIIFPTGLEQPSSGSSIDPVDAYLSVSRINMNVRQVLKPNSRWVDKRGSGAQQNKVSSL